MASQDILSTEAFKRLYPDTYLRKVLASGYRADGRPVEATAECSVGLQPVSTAASSALVKVGNTMVVAGTKLKMVSAEEGEEAAGAVTSSVELSPLCGPHVRPGRASTEALCLTAQVGRLLLDSGALRLGALVLEGGGGAWHVSLDCCVLDSDGSLLDACLLGAVAALAALKVPQGKLGASGKFVASGAAGTPKPAAGPALIDLARVPWAHTVAWVEGQLLAQPTHEEEQLAGALISLVRDSQGRLLGVDKFRGGLAVSGELMQRSFAAAARSQRELSGLLTEALQKLGEGGT